MNRIIPSLQGIPSLLALSITLLIWFIIPVPNGVTPEAWHLFALFTGTILAIIGKAMPIGALSILAITLVAVTQVTRPGNPSGAISDALSGFANPLIWLIALAIMIAVSLTKTGLGARIGYHCVALLGRNTLGIAYGLTFAELCIAPVTPSNTARGGAIIHPIMKAIAEAFHSSPTTGTENTIGRYLALVNYNANPITSAMFITATAPNPLIVDIIAKTTQQDIHITWGQWALFALLPGLCMLLLMPLVLYLLYPPQIKSTPHARNIAQQALQRLGPITPQEIITLTILVLMLLLWAGVPAWLWGATYDFNPTTVAALGLSLLLLTGVLHWDDLLQAKSAWDTLTWFAALVMMATFLSKLGLISWFSHVIELQISQWGLSWISATALLVAIYFYTHYLFASTTAHITAMFAAFYTAGLALGAPPLLLALLLAFSSSLMMSLTHYATGTAPIIFGSGYVSLTNWWTAGWVMSVVNLLILCAVGIPWWHLLGD